MRVAAVRNPDGNTWHLTVSRASQPDMVCRSAPWTLVEQTTSLADRGVTPEPRSQVSHAIGLVLTGLALTLGNPWFWIGAALSGWHACV